MSFCIKVGCIGGRMIFHARCGTVDVMLLLQGPHFTTIDSLQTSFFEFRVDTRQQRFLVVDGPIFVQNVCSPGVFGESLEDSYASAHKHNPHASQNTERSLQHKVGVASSNATLHSS